MVVIQGIYFFNKQNIITNEKVCNYCNRINKLKTYTGFKFFHLYGIPLIPLGKKVVNNECSGCKTYIEFTQKKWKKRKETGIKIEKY